MVGGGGVVRGQLQRQVRRGYGKRVTEMRRESEGEDKDKDVAEQT